MLNILVETKNEYTSHLTNILAPLIYEGLQSIYKESLQISTSTDVLKIFQSFLKRVPKWNQSLIEKETNRIINLSQSYEWFDSLIKATLKTNLIVLLYNPTIKVQPKINQSFYNEISTNKLIHTIYIECAREIWNNPYLFYHKYNPLEIESKIPRILDPIVFSIESLDEEVESLSFSILSTIHSNLGSSLYIGLVLFSNINGSLYSVLGIFKFSFSFSSINIFISSFK